MSANPNTPVTDKPVDQDGVVWHRLHSEREDICESLNKGPVPGDVAADGQSTSTWRMGLLQARLHKIDDALDRLMSGTYGECSKCGKWIEDTKLDFDPAIEFCLGCWALELRKAETDRLAALVDQASQTKASREVTLASQAPFDTITVQTLNSIYRIFLLDPTTSRALVEGGQYLVEPEEGRLSGSLLSDGSFKAGRIGIGSRMQMWVNGWFLCTSPVQSVRVEHAFSDSFSPNPVPELVM